MNASKIIVKAFRVPLSAAGQASDGQSEMISRRRQIQGSGRFFFRQTVATQSQQSLRPPNPRLHISREARDDSVKNIQSLPPTPQPA
jgi:hypothetical protein